MYWLTSLSDLACAEPKFGLNKYFCQKVKWFRWAFRRLETLV